MMSVFTLHGVHSCCWFVDLLWNSLRANVECFGANGDESLSLLMRAATAYDAGMKSEMKGNVNDNNFSERSKTSSTLLLTRRMHGTEKANTQSSNANYTVADGMSVVLRKSSEAQSCRIGK